MWGCFYQIMSYEEQVVVFPTHVGVFPCGTVCGGTAGSLPHACGGVSCTFTRSACGGWSSPRMWGCFPFPNRTDQAVFGLPHACGGVSRKNHRFFGSNPSSPRMWGCFSRKKARQWHGFVFPTHVGVFLKRITNIFDQIGLPHACGGVSVQVRACSAPEPSSPRMWGCFYSTVVNMANRKVFPTHVGVFPSQFAWRFRWECLPHACGGVSSILSYLWEYFMSSPRMWGCFRDPHARLGTENVFPTHVGVFPAGSSGRKPVAGLPHACGGVSLEDRGIEPEAMSSPRMWGCFWIWKKSKTDRIVFPTHVGVFPTTPTSRRSTSSLPHACGGVSPRPACSILAQRSSPRMWGCFLCSRPQDWPLRVFPTHVGVFLMIVRVAGSLPGLPHACGGVSCFLPGMPAPAESSPRMWGCFYNLSSRCGR